MINLKILGRAMGFMFLPTLGILTLLLVGFFDPVAMWNFVKSNDGLAVFVRVILFIAELVLVVILYKRYEKEEMIKNINNDKDHLRSRKISSSTVVYDLFEQGSYRDSHRIYRTSDDNVIVVERM